MPNSDALGIFIIAALLAIGGAADAQHGTAPGLKAEAKPGAAVVAERPVTLKGPEDRTRKPLAEARHTQALTQSVSMP